MKASLRLAEIQARRQAARDKIKEAKSSPYCSLRSGAGLGDSLYLQSIARHLVEQGRTDLEVCTYYPDVFYPLVGKIKVSRFRKHPVNFAAHYTSRKYTNGTSQFIDCCHNARILEPVDLRLDWKVVDESLTKPLKEIGKPVIAVLLPRNPMARIDGFGDSVLPDCRVIQRAINLLKPRCYIVQIGKGTPRYRFEGIDRDLANKTTIADLLDVATAVDGFLGYCSFVVPLAESLRKPALFVWSRKGLNDPHPFVRAIRPEKVFHRPEIMKAVVDDCSEAELSVAAEWVFSRTRKPEEVAA